jgi:hypothetical protein
MFNGKLHRKRSLGKPRQTVDKIDFREASYKGVKWLRFMTNGRLL